jgi:hypothetical protein
MPITIANNLRGWFTARISSKGFARWCEQIGGKPIPVRRRAAVVGEASRLTLFPLSQRACADRLCCIEHVAKMEKAANKRAALPERT